MYRVMLLLLLAGVVRAQTNPLAGDRAAIDVGKGNFRLYCAACHGIHAQGGRGPNLTRGVYNAGDTDADLFRAISDGVEGTEMAGYSARFDEKMIWRFVSYIRSVARVSPVSVPGDVHHGREIYTGKGGCAGCHAIGSKETGIGPPLTRVGRERSFEYLREKLLNPNETVMPEYKTITVTLRDGRTVRGIDKGFDDFSAQLLDTNRQFHSFRQHEVKSMVREERSLMPANFSQTLTKTEQTDLLAYLVSLRGEK